VTRTHWLRSTRGALIALCLLGVSHVAWAQSGETATEGVVVALEKDDIVVDLAGKRGAATGDVIELWRPLKLKHPVTGKVIKDRFRIGTLKLTQVRDALAFARADGALARPPEPGDIVVLRKAHLEETPSKGRLPQAGPAVVSVTPSEPDVVPQDPDTKAVSELFDSLAGADVTKRIIAYEDYVRAHPDGRYAVVLWEEAAQLRRLLAFDATGVGPAPEKPSSENFAGPGEALAGIPISIGVELTRASKGAVLHARRAGEVAYVPTPMQPSGEGYFSVVIPASRMQAPSVEYFIEAVGADGKAISVVGTADAPRSIEVHPIPQPTPPLRHEATVSVWTDYADYNRMKGNDVVWQTEGTVGMRFNDVGLRALRTGFGVFRGVGGSLHELDEQKKSARRVGLTYGYLEAEYAVTSFTALIGRGVIGLRDDGVAGGAQALVRIGNDKSTNLQLGGEVLGGIGLRGITQLELNTFERVPMMFRVEVTNQPAGSAATPEDVTPDVDGTTPDQTSLEVGEVGGRAILQVGYRVMPGLTLAARGSYQGRTIKHAGPGFGGAVTYTW